MRRAAHVEIDHEAWIRDRRHATERVVALGHGQPKRYEFGVIVAVHGDGTWAVQVGNRSHPYDRVGASDPLASFEEGDAVTLGFVESQLGMPIIISRGHRVSEGVAYVEPVGVTGLWVQGQGGPGLAGRTYAQTAPWTPEAEGGPPSSLQVERPDAVSLGLVYANRSAGRPTQLAWLYWWPDGPTWRLYLAAYQVSAGSLSLLWFKELATGGSIPTPDGLQYGHLFYNPAMEQLVALWGGEIRYLDLAGNVLGTLNSGFLLDQVGFADAIVTKDWHTHRFSTTPIARVQQDKYLRAWRRNSSGLLYPAWQVDAETLLAGYEVASSQGEETPYLSNSNEGRWPLYAGKSFVYVSGWKALLSSAQNSLLSVGRQELGSTGFPVAPCSQTAVHVEGPTREIAWKMHLLNRATGESVHSVGEVLAAESVIFEDTAWIGVWDTYFTEHPGEVPSDPHWPKGYLDWDDAPAETYQYSGVAGHLQLELGTQTLTATAGRTQDTGPCSADPEQVDPEPTDYTETRNVEIDGGWGYSQTDPIPAPPTKVFCSSIKGPDLNYFSLSHPLLLPYPGTLGNVPGADLWSLIEWPGPGSASYFGAGVDGTALADYFTRADPVGGTLCVDSEGYALCAIVVPEIFLGGSGKLIPQLESNVAVTTSGTQECSYFGNPGTATYIQTFWRTAWKTYMAPTRQQCSRTLLLCFSPDGSLLWQKDISQRFSVPFPSKPTGATDGTCTYQRATLDNVLAGVPLPEIFCWGLVRDGRDRVVPAVYDDHLPYRCFEYYDKLTGDFYGRVICDDTLDTYDAGGTPTRRINQYDEGWNVVVRAAVLPAAGPINPWVQISFGIHDRQTNTAYERHWQLRWDGEEEDWVQSIHDIPRGGSEGPSLLRDVGGSVFAGNSVFWPKTGGGIRRSG